MARLWIYYSRGGILNTLLLVALFYTSLTIWVGLLKGIQCNNLVGASIACEVSALLRVDKNMSIHMQIWLILALVMDWTITNL